MKRWVVVLRFPLKEISTNEYDFSKTIILHSLYSKVCCMTEQSMVKILVEKNIFEHNKVIIPSKNVPFFYDYLYSSHEFGDNHLSSYIFFGPFGHKYSAKACQKYLCTKFVKALLKVFRTRYRDFSLCWKSLPLQDFGFKSDINWSAPVSLINDELCKKYNLSNNETRFIESFSELSEKHIIILEGNFDYEI